MSAFFLYLSPVPSLYAMKCEKQVADMLVQKTGQSVEVFSATSVGGGSINQAFHLFTNVGDYFVKLNQAAKFPEMFEKEEQGLALLAECGGVNVPRVVGTGIGGADSFLLMDWVEQGVPQLGFWEDFAASLALLHQHSQSQFGLAVNNYMGSLPQSNRLHDDWADFFMVERLLPLLQNAFDAGQLDNKDRSAFENFFLQVPGIFPSEPPALIHGDLWNGNYMVGNEGRVVFIDPAVYYGHREMDLAMTRLFGGFDPRFYKAYNECFPLLPGWENRVDFCNLYPLLVHLVLFGTSYRSSIRNILKPFL